jgi:hypothetical protein
MEGVVFRTGDTRAVVEDNQQPEKPSSQSLKLRSARSIKEEKHAQRRILSLLYIRRLEQPDCPGVAVKDLESLLGRQREQLAFSLWYLRAKSLVATAENGLYEITAEGVSVADVIDTT